VADILRILLLENDPDVARLLLDAFAGASSSPSGHAGIDVDWQSRLADGIDALARQVADVVFVSPCLPDATVADALAQLRLVAPGVPAIVIVHGDDAALAVEALDNGAQDYVCARQASARHMISTARAAVERARAERELARAEWMTGIGEIAQTLQHQLNTPLAVLVAHAQFLAMDGGADDRQESVLAMVQAAQRIASTVRQLTELRAPRGEDMARRTPPTSQRAADAA
jgi:DNA-binding response OmpR family regulator